METLYQLTEQYKQLLQMAEDPEIDPEVLQDTMEGLTGEIEEKAEGYVIVMKELEATEEKIDTEIKRLMKWKSACANSRKRMNNRLKETMLATGKTKLPTEHFNLSIRKNGGVQPMYVTPEIADIPEEFLIRKPVPNNDLIRKALSEGQQLEFAHMEERGTYLSIK